MSLEADDLLDPLGPILPSMFPDDSIGALRTRLEAYLERSTSELTAAVVAVGGSMTTKETDAAVRALTLHYAWNAIAGRLAASPSSASLQGLGSVSTAATSVRYFQLLAHDALALYRSLIPVIVAAVSKYPGSFAVSNRQTW